MIGRPSSTSTGIRFNGQSAANSATTFSSPKSIIRKSNGIAFS